jgi:hypothetical protein
MPLPLNLDLNAKSLSKPSFAVTISTSNFPVIQLNLEHLCNVPAVKLLDYQITFAKAALGDIIAAWKV